MGDIPQIYWDQGLVWFGVVCSLCTEFDVMRFTGIPISHVGWCWVQNVKSVRVNYWVEKMETGIHFEDNVVHTDNQIRRARCWFPCIDDNNNRCWYEIILCHFLY